MHGARIFFCPMRGMYGHAVSYNAITAVRIRKRSAAIQKGDHAVQYQPLSNDEVAASRRAHGSNRITQKKSRGFWSRYAANFSDPIIRILLLALGIQLLLLLVQGGSWMEFGGIGFAVAVSTLVSTLSEYGSERAFCKMRDQAADILCTVLRAEGRIQLPVGDLVAGDLVVLEAGDRVPADGILAEGALTVDQSALNGESRDVPKTPDTATHEAGSRVCADPLTHASCLSRGSIVSGGSGTMLVLRVGDNTLYGSMMADLQTESRESPLKERLTGLARTLSRIGYGAAALVTLSDLFRLFASGGGLSMPFPQLLSHLLHALTLGITTVVVAVPEGLPMMITVVLSSNLFRMAKDNVLVRRPVGIETAGCVNILFTDKTGTLTRGRPQMVSFCDAALHSYPSCARIPEPLRRYLILCAVRNTGSTWQGSEVSGGNATERALLSFCLPSPPKDLLACPVIRRIPFDSANRFSAAAVAFPGASALWLVKGAPELILGGSTSCLTADGTVAPLPDPEPLRARIKALGEQAYRVIAVAVSDRAPAPGIPLRNLTFVGLAVIRDSLRQSAARSVSHLQGAGVQVVMITGDSPDTATAIARECGILKPADRNAVYTGAQLSAMSDDELTAALPKLRVVSRALPSDKSRLVRAAQKCDLVAAMTGDGVNDAPALRAADVGFAMGSGTEAAKEAGDICIRDDNIASIVRAVLYGRTVFRSIRKFLVFQLTMNLCAVGVSVAGSFLGIDTPITVIQMLWINLIMDTLAGLAFAGEAPREEYLHDPPLRRTEPVLCAPMTLSILWTGLYTVGLCVWFLTSPRVHASFRALPGELCFLTGFFTLFVVAGLLNAFNARAGRRNLLSGLLANRSFLPVLLLAAAVQMGLVCFGFSVFRCVPLTVTEWRAVLLPALTVIPVGILRRLIGRRRGGAF